MQEQHTQDFKVKEMAKKLNQESQDTRHQLISSKGAISNLRLENERLQVEADRTQALLEASNKKLLNQQEMVG